MPVSHRRAPRAVRSTTVYTNAPNRRGEARSSHLCTLLWSSRAPTVQQCTQTPQIDAERPNPPICVHSCGPEAPRGCPRSSRRNDSVTGVARAASPGPLPRGDRHRHIIAPEQLPQLLGVLVRDPLEARVRPAVAAVEDDELIAGVQHDVAGLRRLRRRPWAPAHLVVEQGPYIDVTAGR